LSNSLPDIVIGEAYIRTHTATLVSSGDKQARIVPKFKFADIALFLRFIFKSRLQILGAFSGMITYF
tara:strand:+ start:499 stop:699 length:201 start_codon:yes stop_codon:yes gene_type:complete